jgi:hypothetical protein
MGNVLQRRALEIELERTNEFDEFDGLMDNSR